jgi:hypothetical protein
MEDKQQKGKANNLNRREFMREGVLAAAGLSVGLSAMSGEAAEKAVRKTRSYNPEMEYRRLGKTGLWVSALVDTGSASIKWCRACSKAVAG